MRTLLLLCFLPTVVFAQSYQPVPRPTTAPQLYRELRRPYVERDRRTTQKLRDQFLREKIRSERQQRAILNREFGDRNLTLEQEILLQEFLDRPLP